MIFRTFEPFCRRTRYTQPACGSKRRDSFLLYKLRKFIYSCTNKFVWSHPSLFVFANWLLFLEIIRVPVTTNFITSPKRRSFILKRMVFDRIISVARCSLGFRTLLGLPFGCPERALNFNNYCCLGSLAGTVKFSFYHYLNTMYLSAMNNLLTFNTNKRKKKKR